MLTSLAFVLLAAAPSNVQDLASFARVYKPGEKSVYAMTWTNGAIKATIEADVEITVLKVLESGRADLRLHLANKRETGTTTEAAMPADVTVRTSKNNMPEKFVPTTGGIDFMMFFMLLPGITTDKAVKAGDATDWVWDGGSWMGAHMFLKGSTRVIEVSASQSKLVAEHIATWTMADMKMADIQLKSTYDLPDLRLKSSEGTMKMTQTPDTLKFVRKN